MTTRLEDFALKLGGDYLHQRHFADGFRHAIEVLEEWYSNNGGREGGLPHVGQAIHQLKLYADKEEG